MKRGFKIFCVVFLADLVSNLVLLGLNKVSITQDVIIQVLLFSIVVTFIIDKWIVSDNQLKGGES